MNKYAIAHVSTASQIIEKYSGSTPLAAYLKQYFAQYKKYGSKDRKYIQQACYSYFRIGKSLEGIALQEQIKIALYLCGTNIQDWQLLYSNTNWLLAQTIDEKIDCVLLDYPTFSFNKIFNFFQFLSNQINAQTFAGVHLVQPYTYARVRPQVQPDAVIKKIEKHNIAYTLVGKSTLAFNQSNIDLSAVCMLNKEIVIQDIASQQVAQIFDKITLPKRTVNVWDCCAASGGKSILFKDFCSNINLTVSDVRQSILKNLEQRFNQSGIKANKMFVADLTHKQSIPIPTGNNFDVIICDAPCTGSGTWRRTPEQLRLFDANKIDQYSALQKNIVTNITPYLKSGGYLVYITCSVFNAENEEVVQHISQHLKLNCIHQQYFKGFENGHNGDTLFAALFTQ